MENNLTSATWKDTMEAVRRCHISSLNPDSIDEKDWRNAFDLLMASIQDERKQNPDFALEFADLTDASGCSYDFKDILEDYFDYLEDHGSWDAVVTSCDQLIPLFQWKKSQPSEYMFRKGNALERQSKYDEAEAFGKKWLEEYPDDLYAAASNVFLMVELKKYEEAELITKQYLSEDLVCNENTDTFFMAAYRLFEMTDDINAKQRVEKKMAEYEAMTGTL